MFAYAGGCGLAFEYSRGWRGFRATVGYGGQESFLEWCFAVPGLFLHLRLDTPFKWHRLRPRDGEFGESEAEFGLCTYGGGLYFRFGHEPMGSYGPRRRWRWLRSREVRLFHKDWILGKPRFSETVLERDIPVVVDVGQWDGDRYEGTATRQRCRWKRRFRTIERENVRVEMAQGIPVPGKGENSWDCGDDAYFGFGGATVDEAVAHIVKEAKKERARYGGPNWRPLAVVA